MKKILMIFGTRPEAIKLAPLYFELKKYPKSFDLKVCVTAQHRGMLDQVLKLFKIKVNIDLNIMKKKQDLFDTNIAILKNIKKVINKVNPNLILVHGDTTTAYVSSLAGFYLRIKIAHVEAGLRTHNIFSPYPEEFNRKSISILSDLHFTPTKDSMKNLKIENLNRNNIFITGNTVVDSLNMIKKIARKKKFSQSILKQLSFLKNKSKFILVTAHRRENFGEGFKNICYALKMIANENPMVKIVFPVHLNPNVKNPVEKMLSNIDNIFLIKPLDYMQFIKLLEKSYIILTDSGGIQEEAPSFGKPVLVMRNNTERPEGVKAGLVKLVGSDYKTIVSEVKKVLNNKKIYIKMKSSKNPYGDGKASKRITAILKSTKI